MQNALPEDWEAQLIDYSLGIMDPAQAAAFEASLEECRLHVMLAGQYADVAGVLARTALPADPPEGHKTRLMSRIASTPQQSVAAEAAAGASTGAGPLSRTATSSVPALAGTGDADGTEAYRGATVTDLGQYREIKRSGGPRRLVAAMGAVAAALVLLVGVWGWWQSQQAHIPSDYRPLRLASADPNNPAAAGVVLYSPDKNDAIFVANDLPTLPADKVYELWILQPQGKGNHIKAGVFAKTENGNITTEARAPSPVGNYAGFALTVEPAPGVDVSVGTPVIVGTFAAP